MKDISSELIFSKDGETYAKLCIDVTVYWRGSVFDRSGGVVRFYQRALTEIGSSLSFYETGTMTGAKPLKKDTLEMIPFWFQKAKRRSDMYIMTLESGTHPNEPSDRSFYLIADEDEEGDEVGAMRVSFPISYAASTDKFVALTRELVSELDFESGHAGYSINWDPLGDMAVEAEQKMYSISKRFLGVDLYNINISLISMRKTKPAGIKCVNWLTLLGKSLTQRVGPLEKLRGQLTDGFAVYSLPSGVIIRAGEQPTMGDRNRNVDISAYRRVGRLLAPFRFVDHKPIFGAVDTADPNPTTDWLARFDD